MTGGRLDIIDIVCSIGQRMTIIVWLAVCTRRDRQWPCRQPPYWRIIVAANDHVCGNVRGQPMLFIAGNVLLTNGVSLTPLLFNKWYIDMAVVLLQR